MKLTKRESWLVALLPPVLLLGSFHVLGARVERRSLAAQRTLEGTDPVAGGLTNLVPRLEWTRKDCARLEGELDAMHARGDALDVRRKALLARWSHADERAASVRALLQLLEESGITVRRSESLGAQAAGPTPPPGMRELERGMLDIGAEAPQLWRFDLVGAYGSMRKVLQDCVDIEHFDLPVAVAAKPAETGDELAFTLWLWI